MTEENVFVALGSNLGDRRSNLDRAIEAVGRIPGTNIMAVSDYLWTPPWGVREQPWFLNAAARIRTSFGPSELLRSLLLVENAAGRVRGVRNGPRTLDLDLLVYGASVIDEPGLSVPHPRLCERRFVLAPLAQIAPDFVHPVRGVTFAALLSELDRVVEGAQSREATVA